MKKTLLFTICLLIFTSVKSQMLLQENPSAPINDDCSGAITLTAGDNFNTNPVVGTTLSANSSGVSLGCGGDYDVWYKAVIPASGSLTIETDAVSGSQLTDTTLGVYSGLCGALSGIDCNDDNPSGSWFSKISLTGRTPGETIYIAVNNLSTEAWENGEFKISAYDIPAPINDNCSGAITLTAGDNFNTNPVVGTTLSANSSSVSLGCGGNYDVWYKAVIPASGSLTIETDAVSGSQLTDTILGVYSGLCGTLSSIDCNDDKSSLDGSYFSKISLTGRTPGETIYIAVYNYSEQAWTNGEFKVSAYDIPVPINDDCSGAITLTAGNNFNTNPVIGTTLKANSSSVSLSCGGNYDVWYKAVIPASGSLTIETDAVNGSQLTDTTLGVYSGLCGALSSIDCNDDNLNGSYFSKISLTGRTPGETIYIAVNNFASEAWENGEFKLSVYDLSVIQLSKDTFDLTSLSFYPNPVENVFNVNYSEPISTIQISTILGQTVLVKKPNSDSVQVDLSNLASGAYFVKLTSGSLVKTIKIIKQ